MNITRNNYEEYFLLYADGELNSSDKAAVESFVSIHPDLAEELDMLMESILATTDIIMPNKHLLLKTEEWNEENLTSIQQQMLLLLDNELPAEDATELTQEIAKDPILQKDWSILQQTRLAETVTEMPGKESLYRNERDRKPIPIGWVKWMAAAAVVAGIGWYGLSFINGNKTVEGPSVARVNEVKKAGNNNSTAPALKENNEENKATNSTVLNSPVDEKQPSALQKTESAGKEELSKNRKATTVNQQGIQPNNVPVPLNTNSVIKAPELAVQEIKTPANNYLAVAHPKEIENSYALPVKEPNNSEGSLAQQAIYNEDAIDEPEYVNIAGARIKKQKLRGIFRNVTRTVGRTFDKSNVAQADVASLNK
jgi:hypothetical protein